MKLMHKGEVVAFCRHCFISMPI